MTRAIPTSDSTTAVDTSWLVPVFEPGDNPASTDPQAQTIADLVRSMFTAAMEAKLDGIAAGAEVNLTGNALQSAIDTAVGSSIWRSAHTVLRTAVQTRDLLDGLLGSGWRTGGGGGGGISLDQAIDGVGAALAMLSEFTYDAAANTFTFSLAANSVTAAQARANSDAHKTEWRNRIGAISRGDTATEAEAGTVEKSTDDELDAGTAGKYPDAEQIKAFAQVLADQDPSADTVRKLILRGGRLYLTHPVHHEGKDVDWRLFATADLPGGYTWGGSHQVNPALGGLANNTVFYSIPAQRALRVVTLGIHKRTVTYNLPGWLGVSRDEADADRKATANNQTTFFGGQVRVSENYVGSAPDTYEPDLYEYDLQVQLDALTARIGEDETDLREVISAFNQHLANLPEGVSLTADALSGLLNSLENIPAEEMPDAIVALVREGTGRFENELQDYGNQLVLSSDDATDTTPADGIPDVATVSVPLSSRFVSGLRRNGAGAIYNDRPSAAFTAAGPPAHSSGIDTSVGFQYRSGSVGFGHLLELFQITDPPDHALQNYDASQSAESNVAFVFIDDFLFLLGDRDGPFTNVPGIRLKAAYDGSEAVSEALETDFRTALADRRIRLGGSTPIGYYWHDDSVVELFKSFRQDWYEADDIISTYDRLLSNFLHGPTTLDPRVSNWDFHRGFSDTGTTFPPAADRDSITRQDGTAVAFPDPPTMRFIDTTGNLNLRLSTYSASEIRHPVLKRVPGERLLPALPAAGARDRKIPRFTNDVLTWQNDGSGVPEDQELYSGDDLAADAYHTAGLSAPIIDGRDVIVEIADGNRSTEVRFTAKQLLGKQRQNAAPGNAAQALTKAFAKVDGNTPLESNVDYLNVWLGADNETLYVRFDRGGPYDIKIRQIAYDGDTSRSGFAGGSGQAADGTPRPYTVRFFARFADAALVDGNPPSDPVISISDAGVSLTEDPYYWNPNEPAGDAPRWEVLTQIYYNAGWSHRGWSYRRTNPADGAVRYATDEHGANASETPPAGWTHFAERNELGGLGPWIARGGQPDRQTTLFSFHANWEVTGLSSVLRATGLNVSPEINLDDYQDIWFEWEDRAMAASAPGFTKRSTPLRSAQIMTQDEIGDTLVLHGVTLRVALRWDINQFGIYTPNPSSSGWNHGCNIGMVLKRGSTARHFDNIRIATGSYGTGLLSMRGGHY